MWKLQLTFCHLTNPFKHGRYIVVKLAFCSATLNQTEEMQTWYSIKSHFSPGPEVNFSNVFDHPSRIVRNKTICKKFYFLFLRLKNPTGNIVFKINPINYQPAATEINDESALDPIFEAIGRNAHMPLGVSGTTDGMCKPYIDSGHVCFPSALLILLASSFFLVMY